MGVAGTKAWTVFGEMGLDGMSRTMGQLAAFDKAGKGVAGTMLGVESAGMATAAAAGILAGAVGVGSVAAFASFDDMMTGSLAMMGDVSDMMRGEMSDAAREVGRETVFSASQAAESYFFLASAGLSAEQSIAALPQVAAFAQAGLFDMALATDLLTDAQSALGLTVKDATTNQANMARVSDVLVKANTLANATVEQFSVSLTSQAGPAMKAYGRDLEEGVAVLAAYADQGIKAELAGSGYSRVLRLLSKSALDNADAHKTLGFSVFDSEGNMRNMALVVGDLERILAGATDQQKAATLEALGFQARVQQMILPLIGTSAKIRDYEKALRDAGGTTQDVADKQMDSLKKEFGLLGGEVKDLALGHDKGPRAGRELL